MTPGGAQRSPLAGLAPIEAPDGRRVEIFQSLDDCDRAAWDELAGRDAVVRSYDYLRAIAAAGINDCRYFYPVVFDRHGQWLAHCCVYTITTDLAQILPALLKPFARALRRLWPGFLQVRITECASPHVIGHGFSLRAGQPRGPLLMLLEAAIAKIARASASPLIVIRDFTDEELPDFTALTARGYQQVANQPLARIRLRWASYADYLAAMRSRYRKDLGRRLRRAAAQAQTVELLESFGHLAESCAAQVRAAYDRSQGIKREVLGPAYFRALDDCLGAQSALLVARRGPEMVGQGMVLFDRSHIIATYSGRSEGPPDDIWFQLLDSAVREGLARGLKWLNLGLGSYAAKSLMGAELAPLSCFSRSRYGLVNWLMRKVPRRMEADLPRVHHVFQDED